MSGSLPKNLLSPLGADSPMPGGSVGAPGAAMGAGAGAGAGLQLPSAPPSQSGSVQDALDQHYTRSKNAFQNTKKALKQLDVIRSSLEHLSSKQDTVTMEDVVGEASKLVAHGIDPVALAGLLADAPQQGGGEALGGWIAGHAQTAMAAEQQLIQQHAVNRHEMGVTALHGIMAHIAGHGFPEEPAGVPGGESPQENPLQAGGGGTSDPSATEDAGLGISPEATGNPLAYGARFMHKYDRAARES